MELASQRVARIAGHVCPEGAGQNGGLGALHMNDTKAAGAAKLPGFDLATTMTAFPPAVHNQFALDDLLTAEEKGWRDRVRKMAETQLAPYVVEYWEKAEFPFQLVPAFKSLNLAGTTIKGYGCPGISTVAAGVAVAELARVDASCSTFIMVHSCLAMATISMLGSEQQKQKYLPGMARLDQVGCWALTEPEAGSDAAGLISTAKKVPGGWLINGRKRWIGNSTWADIIIVFARCTQSGKVKCFIVKKGAKGYRATKIENKLSLRIVQNGDITMEDIFVADEDCLPGCDGFQDTAKVLAASRVMVGWQPVGISMGVFDMCVRYLSERKQFGAPLASMQLSQEKLARMAGNVQACFLMAWRVSQMYDAGKMDARHASLAKSWITLRARETVALGRELLGGNGIQTDYLVAKAFADLEAIYSYEGTYDVNALVVGRELTGIAAIKPAPPKAL
eukprot:jgi/Mesvir1/6567/Mv16824-RA.1